jgi:hypothetical protein
MKIPFIRADGTGFYVEMAQKTLESLSTMEIPETYEFTDWGTTAELSDYEPPPRRSFDRVKFEDRKGPRYIYIESR